MTKKKKLRGRDQMVAELKEANRISRQLRQTNDAIRKTNRKLQLDVDKIAGEMVDARQSNGKLTRRNEEMLHQLGEMNSMIEDMYRESYGLVKCLNATRESWMKAEDKIQKFERGQQTQAFTMKVEIADATQDGDDPACTFVAPVGANAD